MQDATPQIQILSLKTCCKTSRRRQRQWHGNSKPLCGRKRLETPQQLLRVVFFYTAAWISRFGKPPPTSHCCTSRLRTRRLRSAWPPVGRGCRRYWRKCCIPMLSPRSRRPVLVIDGSHVQGPGDIRGPSIACTSVWNLVQLHICGDYPHGSAYRRKPRPASPLGPGDIALADRGYAYATPIVGTGPETGHGHPPGDPAHLPVYGRDGQRVALMQVLREQPKWETSHTMTTYHRAGVRQPGCGARLYPRVSSVRGGTSQCGPTAPPRPAEVKKGRTP